MSKEIPILFSTPMVQAILDGRKTMTRRIIKPQPEQKVMGGAPMKALTAFIGEDDPLGWTWKGTRYMPWPEFLENHCCPYGKPGDILWVRESFAFTQFAIDKALIVGRGEYGIAGSEIYKADLENNDWDGRWKPSIHMPKAAARIWLEVTDVKVERLQDISDGDVAREGVTWNEPLQIGRDTRNCKSPAQRSFRRLWDKINGVESWDQNPWLWVVSFKVLSTTGKP